LNYTRTFFDGYSTVRFCGCIPIGNQTAILQFFLNRKSLTARDLRVQISRFDFRLV